MASDGGRTTTSPNEVLDVVSVFERDRSLLEYLDGEGIRPGVRVEMLNADGVLELRTAGRERALDELGDVLFAAVNTARKLSVDPELALRQATLRFV